MNKIDEIMTALDERTIAREVGILHDETRLGYPPRANTVGSFSGFETGTGDYYNYHYCHCFTNGGHLSQAVAKGRAKELIEREYRRRNGDIVTAYNDAHDGTNGGMRAILDIIAEGLKEEAIGHYVVDVFDRHVARNSWEDKVQIIEEFIARCGSVLGDAIQADNPARYAHDWRRLVEGYVQGLRRTSSMFRSL